MATGPVDGNGSMWFLEHCTDSIKATLTLRFQHNRDAIIDLCFRKNAVHDTEYLSESEQQHEIAFSVL